MYPQGTFQLFTGPAAVKSKRGELPSLYSHCLLYSEMFSTSTLLSVENDAETENVGGFLCTTMAPRFLPECALDILHLYVCKLTCKRNLSSHPPFNTLSAVSN